MPFGPPQGYQQPQQPGYQQPPQYQQQYQAPPPGGYQQPPPGGYQAPPSFQPVPPRPQRTPTLRNAHTSDVLIAAGGVVAFGAGVDSLGGARFAPPAQYLILGVFALIIGLFALVMVTMPNVLKALDNVMGLTTTGLGAVMLVWGLAACFLSNVGWNGGLVASAGISMVFGGMLKMGIVK
jgi:hypothetical protein